MKLSVRLTGLVQAAGVALYVGLFAFSIQCAQQWFTPYQIQPRPLFSIIIFLLLFIISALICASIMFTYPVLLFFDNKKMDALKIVLWSILWLIILFVVFGLVGLILLINKF